MDEPREGPDPTPEVPTDTPSDAVADGEPDRVEHPAPAPEPRPSPVTVVPAVQTHPRPEPPRRTRRWFVTGVAAVAVGGGAGVAVDFARGRPRRAEPKALPGDLQAAIADERRLLARARAVHGLPAGVRAVLVRDHEAHLAALTAAAAGYAAPEHNTNATVSPPGAPDRDHQRLLETLAAQGAARRARSMTGDTAAVLASIAACEATHAELLS